MQGIYKNMAKAETRIFCFKTLVLMISVLGALLITSRPVGAVACCGALADCEAELAACTLCVQNADQNIPQTWTETIREINDHTTEEFEDHEEWIIDTWWGDHVLPALMSMADQLSAIAMQQTLMIGGFIDAKHQMETQRVLQTIRARAHKDYHPSVGMCEFGTSVKSLAASERKAELNAHVMSKRSLDRSLGSSNTAAAIGPASDFENRLQQYREKFCDVRDNDGGLQWLCDHDQLVPSTESGAADPERTNKDIDYVRTVEQPWTLNIDFTDQDITEHEEEILALSSNLYGHEVFKRPVPAVIKSPQDGVITTPQLNYMDARAHLAKRSVAENSFNAITSMKSAGTSSSRKFLEAIMSELGVKSSGGDPNEMLRLLGMDDSDPNEKIGPSYYAQMEVLTKKIYQNPDFYTNLYDKPVNVERKQVAMQAIGLIQKFDLYKSYLRNEANLSVLLELAVEDLQGEAENDIRSQPN